MILFLINQFDNILQILFLNISKKVPIIKAKCKIIILNIVDPYFCTTIGIIPSFLNSKY